MNDLHAQIIESASKLEVAWTGLQGASGSIPSACYDFWRNKASFHASLGKTADLFSARKTSWEAVIAVNSATGVSDKQPNHIRYLDSKILEEAMEYSMARLLSLTSFVTTSWAIYDRLANVCGRISGIESIANDPKQNPKLCEDLLDGKQQKALGFGVHHQLKASYGWPIRVSYKLRNWIVHEGEREGEVRLFRGDAVKDRLLLHDDAVKILQQYGSRGSGTIGNSCIETADDVWPTQDLVRILESYHSEIDTMFCGLLKWNVDSQVAQIQIFSQRDRI